MEIVVFKTSDVPLPDSERQVVRRYLFDVLRGVSERDRNAWAGFWRGVAAAPIGEHFTIVLKRKRNSKFHKLIFVVLNAVFEAQEVFPDFRVFVAWAKLGAGFCDYLPAAGGGLHAVPRSTSFGDCTEEEAQQFFLDVTAFLRMPMAQYTLWPAASPQAAEEGMMRILRKFDKQP